MKLFCHSAGLQDGSSSYIPDGEMVKKIVKGCGGFPLALKVVGKSLCGKPAVAWLVRVAKWSDGCSILDTDIESELLENLQSSLDFKGPEMILGECFMDLGSFPEDQRIPVATLIDMWSELYEPVVDGIHAIANLHEINNLNLVSLVATRQDVSEVGSYCSEDFVLQHDLLRELAIHQCRKEPFEQRKRLIIDISGNINIPKWWTEEREQPIDAQLLSISTGCLRLRNPLPPSTMNLEKLELVICDKERAKLWEPIREYFRMALSLHMDIRIAEKDINLNWLTNRL
ncbi:hypothetical protein CIPAW_01G024800 [Carya illinoinensis]|nr:hypothetical protein CIPAW_01G024800 [Carya illinoinensis]KAG6666342.1 hypothetical protein CIPAW_01G024800 [Carya illinoinensis]